MDNMQLWKSVCMTDPKAVKPITGKTYQGNSPKPYWLIQRATEVFGPVGIGWGMKVVSERFERLSETDTLHVATVSVWFVDPASGKRSEGFEQMGGTKAAYMANSGKLIVDEDAGKKSVTDALVKCLSMIGFAGDIFSGRWDDSKYVAEANRHYREQEGEANPGRAKWLDGRRAAIMGAMNVGELKRVLAAAVDLAMSENDGAAVEQLNAWAELKRAQAKTAAEQA